MSETYLFKADGKIEAWEQLGFNFQEKNSAEKTTHNTLCYISSPISNHQITNEENIDLQSVVRIVKPTNHTFLTNEYVTNLKKSIEQDENEDEFSHEKIEISSGLKFQRKYYLIGDIAEILKISTSNIRFWETQIDVLKPKKNKKGIRYFTNYDLRILYLIFVFTRKRKWTIQECNHFFKQNHTYLKTYHQYIERLIASRNKLVEAIQN